MFFVFAVVVALVWVVRGWPEAPPALDSPDLIAARREVDEIERLAMGIIPDSVKHLAPSGPSYEQYVKQRDRRRHTHEIVMRNMCGDVVATYQDPNDMPKLILPYEIRPIRRTKAN